MGRVKLRNYDSQVNSGLSAFEKAFGITKSVMDSYQKSKITDMQKAGLADAQAKADASGGERAVLNGVDGLKDGETEASITQSASDFIKGMSPEELALAKAALNAEETKRVAGLQPQPAPQNVAAPQPLGPQAAETPGTSIPSAPPGTYTVPTPATTTPLGGATPAPTTADPATAPSRPVDQLTKNQDTRTAPEAATVAGLKPKMTLDTVKGPKLDAMDIYRKEAVPGILKKMIEQGRMEDAQKFEAWADSGTGKSYMKTWVDGRMAIARGDHAGAMKTAEELYNKQVPDGQYVSVKPGSKEGLWVVEVRDEKTNKMVQPPREDSAENWNTYAYGHGNPEAAYKHLLDLDAAAAAKKDKAADATLAHERAKELKTLDPGKTSTLGQLITDRDKAIALHGPKHPDVLAFIKAIKKAETASGGLQVSFGSMGTITTDDEGNVVAGQVGKDGRPRVTRLGIVDPKVLAQDKAIKVAKDKIANLVKEGAGRYSDRATGTRVFPDDATLKLSEMEYTTKEYKDQYDPKPGLKPKP